MSDIKNEIVETVEGTVEDASEIRESETVKESDAGSSYPTQMLLTIRALVGGYLLYLTYGLITSEDAKSPMIYVAIAVFLIAGILLIAFSIKRYIKGEYEGGKSDKRN